MKQFFLTVLGVFAGLILFVVVMPFVLIIAWRRPRRASRRRRANAVLELDLRDGHHRPGADQSLRRCSAAPACRSWQVVDTLAQAEKDDHVKGLLIRLPEGGLTPAAADEIRQAVRRFRASGKPVIAHSQGFQPVGTAISSYMVGAAASELWMQNTASFQAGGLLGRQRSSWAAPSTNTASTPSSSSATSTRTPSTNTRSATTPAPPRGDDGLDDLDLRQRPRQRRAATARSPPAALKATIEAGPYSAGPGACNCKLIDKIGQVEEAEAEAKRRAGAAPSIVEFDDYAADPGRAHGLGPRRHRHRRRRGRHHDRRGRRRRRSAAGRRSTPTTRPRPSTTPSRTSSVKAIVFRVSSPGGSPEASEQILAAVRAAKAARQAGGGLDGRLRGLGRLLDQLRSRTGSWPSPRP